MFEELARDGENVDDCVGVIINVNSFEMLQATNSSYCEYSLVGDVVLSVISSIPVSPVNHTFYSDIAYIIQKSVGEGLYEQLVKGAQKKHVGPSKCNSEEKSHHEEEGVSVNAMELSSPIFFTFIMTTAGLFLCLYNVPTQQKKKLEHDIGTANDLALTEGIVRPSQPHMKSSVYTQDEWAEVSGKNSNRLRELVHKGATRTNKDLSRKGSENDFYDSVLEGVTGSTSIDKGELAGNSAARTTPQELATMGSERNGGDNPDEDDYYNYILRKYSDLSLRYSDRASKRRRPSAHRL
uniref:Uncharacterized protein n=1 Tax=Leptocylindrus danicus TaxID=163516 RepID=A0A7S2K6A1_9STRA